MREFGLKTTHRVPEPSTWRELLQTIDIRVPIAKLVDSAGKVTKHRGWQTNFDLDDNVHEQTLTLDQGYKPNPFSLFRVMKAMCNNEQRW